MWHAMQVGAVLISAYMMTQVEIGWKSKKKRFDCFFIHHFPASKLVRDRLTTSDELTIFGDIC